MNTPSNKRAIGEFSNRQNAEYAVTELVDHGFPIEKVSIVAEDTPQEQVTRKYVLIVEGTQDEIRRAEAILSREGIEGWGVYDPSDRDLPDTGPTSGWL